ncbi:hypothetical protein [Desulfoluna butyratoxydans]|uniref:Uncharacterized protein n=1 Tax=Desulfoluna butyratoxydans TaxID=231438 RepID=A0A4U8YJG5_9BACT|nr:hypothetical protein [Desulfoluna butyratoxydans]VFQ43895.1 hypothetical protein MSL71_15380 [Desulfoluna butyratoxydans]
MGNKKSKKNNVDPERQMALDALPPNIRKSLTDEEVELFLHAEVWPEEMCEKLNEFLSPE